MFVGHFAVAFAAKRAAPKTSLGILFAAAQWADLLWPFLLLAGIEEVRIDPGNTAFTPLAFVRYPISHSLLTIAGWSLLAGSLVWLLTRYRAGALAVGALVASHWVLDAASHRPDMPLSPFGSTVVGFGLWNSVPATIAVEAAMFGAAVWLYATGTRPRDATGRYALWSLVAFLSLLYLGVSFGPPPPDVRVLAFTGLAGWLLPFWAAWADRHRTLC
jgi:hypothetical protein